MSLHINFGSQRQGLLRVIYFYSVFTILLLIIALQPFVQLSTLTRDPLALTEGEFYYGLLSNIGILFWCAASSICMFSYLLLIKLKPSINHGFFLYASFLSLFLLLVDLFMMHESMFPSYLKVNEKVFLALYHLSIIYFLWHYRERIFNSTYLVLISSLVLLGFSMVIDIFIPTNDPIEYILEDGSKFLGIVGWFYYLIQTSFSTLKKNMLSNQKEKPQKRLYKRILTQRMNIDNLFQLKDHSS